MSLQTINNSFTVFIAPVRMFLLILVVCLFCSGNSAGVSFEERRELVAVADAALEADAKLQELSEYADKTIESVGGLEALEKVQRQLKELYVKMKSVDQGDDSVTEDDWVNDLPDDKRLMLQRLRELDESGKGVEVQKMADEVRHAAQMMKKDHKHSVNVAATLENFVEEAVGLCARVGLKDAGDFCELTARSVLKGLVSALEKPVHQSSALDDSSKLSWESLDALLREQPGKSPVTAALVNTIDRVFSLCARKVHAANESGGRASGNPFSSMDDIFKCGQINYLTRKWVKYVFDFYENRRSDHDHHEHDEL